MDDGSHHTDQAMEDPTQFDLDNAIRTWRSCLENSPAIREQDLDELDGHLRDSTVALQSKGLALEDSFLIATRRLGQHRLIEREFRKANLPRVWMDRSLWMIVGLLFYAAVGWCSYLGSNAMLRLAGAASTNPHTLGFLLVCTEWVVIAAAIIAFWFFATRFHERLSQWARFCVERPLIPGLAIIFANYGWRPAAGWLANFLSTLDFLPSPDREFFQQAAPILNAWSSRSWWIESGLWIGGIIWLARHLYLTRQSSAQAPSACRIEDLELPEKERARTLLSRGLGLDEAIFIVTQRGGYNCESNSVSGDRGVRQLWLDRGLWMTVGVVFNREILATLYLALQNATLGLARFFPVNYHLLGFFLVCVQWAVAAAVVAGFWRVVTRFDVFANRIARFSNERPVLATIGLLLLYYLCCAGLLSWTMHTVPSPQGDIQVVLRWSQNGYEIFHNVVSVVLLFWLARRSPLYFHREFNER